MLPLDAKSEEYLLRIIKQNGEPIDPEKLVEKITIFIPLSVLNKGLIAELADLTKAHPGNTQLCFKVMDKDTRMAVDLVSRPVKLNVGRELISYLKGHPDLRFQIN